jgi:hypothetical protein
VVAVVVVEVSSIVVVVVISVVVIIVVVMTVGAFLKARSTSLDLSPPPEMSENSRHLPDDLSKSRYWHLSVRSHKGMQPCTSAAPKASSIRFPSVGA